MEESAQKALDEALNKAGFKIGNIRGIVTTGYGRQGLISETRMLQKSPAMQRVHIF